MPIENGVNAKIISSMEKLLPQGEPSFELEKGTALLGETYNIQLAFRCEERVPLIGETTLRLEGALASFAEIFVEELVPAGTYGPDTDDYYIGKEHQLLPDVLKPMGQIGLPGIPLPYMQWRGVWISFCIPKEYKAGEYSTKFTLLASSGKELVTLEHTIEIIGASLGEFDLVTTNWMHYDCIHEKHGVALFSDKFYKVFESYLNTYVDIGFNTLLTPLFTPPLDTAVGCGRYTSQLIGVRKQRGEYSFSFANLKKFIRFALAHGIKSFEFSHLFTQWGGRATPKIMANVDGKFSRIFGWDVPSDDPEYKKFLSVFLPKLVAFLEREGVEGQCYFHLTDEPITEHLPTYTKCRALVKGLIGDLPIIDALSHGEFYDQGLVDIPVAVLDHYPEFKERKVYPLFSYNCCSPANGYYSNRFIHFPSQRTRVLGIQLYQTGVQGYLHWGYNFYNSRLSFMPIDPYSNTDASGAFPSGDGFIVYPFKDGVIPSVRSQSIKEGFEDYRALKTLETFVGREKVLDLLKEWGFDGYQVYPRCAKTHAEFRNTVNQLIKEQVSL